MGFLLAGGKSSRMGVDKAFLQFNGETLLDRALRMMDSVCHSSAIVGDPAKFSRSKPSIDGSTEYEPEKSRQIVTDIFPGCGPLGGIHAALLHSPAELNLILAVDMPFVSPELLEFLFVAAEAEISNSETSAVVTIARTSPGLQPLCAIYRRSFSVVAEKALRAGKYKIDETFSSVPIRIIDETELATAGFSDRNFFNVNTPQDRITAERSGS